MISTTVQDVALDAPKRMIKQLVRRSELVTYLTVMHSQSGPLQPARLLATGG